jgi:hypothetical protein
MSFFIPEEGSLLKRSQLSRVFMTLLTLWTPALGESC